MDQQFIAMIFDSRGHGLFPVSLLTVEHLCLRGDSQMTHAPQTELEQKHFSIISELIPRELELSGSGWRRILMFLSSCSTSYLAITPS